MKFTDIFIRRPVLAVSISLLIIILGLQAISKLAVREYPKMTTTVITVTTAYPGADANLIQAFVTSKIEEAVAQADNVDYMSSSSSPSTHTLSAQRGCTIWKHTMPRKDSSAYKTIQKIRPCS